MKYKVVKEDKNLLQHVNILALSKVADVSLCYLYLLKRGERIATEAVYKKVKKALDRLYKKY